MVDAGGADRAALPEGRQFGYVKVRYRGLAKNTAQLHTPFALTNIWMARRKFLVTG